MSEIVENEVVEERQPFIVDDDQKAEWCLAQIKAKKEELAKWQAHYEELFDRVRKTIESDILWFEGSLKGYFFQVSGDGFTKETKTQESYALPSGKLVMKKQEPEYVRDEEEILGWLHANAPEFIKTKESVDWSGLKKTLVVSGETMVTEDAEVVPGITVATRPDVFKVEVK